MFCQQCGNEIPDDSRFCTSCGAPAPVTARAPVSENTGYIPPVNNNTGYIPPVQQQAPYAQPAYNGGYAAPQPKAKKTLTKWPPSIGIMGVISLVFFVAALVMLFLYYTENLYMPLGSFVGSHIIDLILAVAVPVLFFIHTRKLAFLTAIPMVISLVLTGIYAFRDFRYLMDDVSMVRNFLVFAFELILVIFYILQMTIRPHNPALSILYLIFAVLELIVLAIFLVIFVTRGRFYTFMPIYQILNYISSVFLSVTYIMAMFASRKK